MTPRLIVFAVWCLLVLGGASYASFLAWSPYTDEQRSSRAGFYGPTHK
ncbi:hypothetical protein [Novosphingobium sp. AP12]|nr:hypothetical protein [Novosphingobium sp. AP12]EJL33451.1 hypothetical protein PMI02_01097 [Novosphingobium sp. AP12]